MTPDQNRRIAQIIAADIAARADQVNAAVTLLDEGATVPFIARYRKEVTGGLDDTQLRRLAERLDYLRELETRRVAVLESIRGQGVLTDALAAGIARAVTKAELEDLYLPFKPKRRTKAMIARENGLGPLAAAILERRAVEPAVLAAGYVTEAVADVKAALEGARDIIAEGLAEDAGLLARLRSHMKAEGRLAASVVAGKEAEGAKFSDYFAHSEGYGKAAGHRVLAMLRGRNEGFLSLDLEVEADAARGTSSAERMCSAQLKAVGALLGDVWLKDAASWAWRVKLKTSLGLELMGELRDRARRRRLRYLHAI